MGIFLVAGFQYLHIFTILCLFTSTGNYPSILKQWRGKYGEKTSIPDKCCMPFPGNFPVNEPKICHISLLAILGPWTTRKYSRHPGGVLEMRSWRMSLESKEDTVWQSKVAMGTPNLEISLELCTVHFLSIGSWFLIILGQIPASSVIGRFPISHFPMFVAETFPVGSHSKFRVVKLFISSGEPLNMVNLWKSKKKMILGYGHCSIAKNSSVGDATMVNNSNPHKLGYNTFTMTI